MKRERLRRFLAVLLGLWLGWRVLRLAAGTPSVETSWAESTRVTARDGRVLGERRSPAGMLGRRTPLDEVSPRLVMATLASEDRAFHRHDGIDRAAALRALWTNVRRGRVVSGGSTITAQLVKRLDHEGRAHERTLLVKLVEAARAQNLEAALDKKTILEAYLAHIDYGHGLAGPEAAAQAYFGASARDVSLAQAALLAVLPRAPSALDPYRHLDRAVARQRALLEVMHGRGEITTEDLGRALAEPIVVRPYERPLVAAHVVLSADGDARTTLDFDLQRDVESILRSHAGALRARGAGGVAAVVVDNATGEVVAEAGSADYFDARNAGAVDVVRRKRQAGSTLKPFVYARAFEGGLSPMAPLPDVPTELGTTGAVYAPDNFDGAFVGPVSAREALAGSLNVPAVRVAASVGARDVVSVLRRSGLALSGGAERYGLSIALGSAEVSPWELAEAYVTLARGGEHVVLRDRVDNDGAAAAAGERVLDASAVALVADALSDSFARVRGLHARGPFELPFAVALKTGTSTGYRDAWTAGYTHERTVVVWVGNPGGAPTNRVTGASGAGPVFFDVMKRAMRDVSPRGALFDREVTEVAEVCPLSGDLPTRSCPDRVERRFARGKLPSATCAMHRHDASTNRTVVVLPPVYGRFLAERAPGAPGMDAHGLPWLLESAASAAAPEGATTNGGGTGEPRVLLVKPRSGAVFRADESPSSADAFEVIAEAENLPRSVTLEVLVDGEPRASLPPPLYRALVPITVGDHLVEVRPRDPTIRGRVARADFTVR